MSARLLVILTHGLVVTSIRCPTHSPNHRQRFFQSEAYLLLRYLWIFSATSRFRKQTCIQRGHNVQVS